jgi:hypothetical protein
MLLGTGGRLSLPLDDAFIFFQYARQFASGHPFHYSGSDAASGGVTSVMTLLVDAVGYLVGFRGDGMIVFSFLLGAAGLWIALTAAHRLGRSLELRHPTWPPLFVLFCGPLLWGLHAGMDLPFFVGPLLATIAAWTEEARQGPSRRGTLIWGSVTAASRPEGLVFGVLLAVFLLLERRPDEGPRKSRAAWTFGLPVLAGLLPALILFLFTGRPSPTSLQVKGVLGLPGVDLGTWIGGALEYFTSVVRAIFFGFEGERPARLQANNGSGVLFYLAPLTLVLFFAGLLPGAAREATEKRSGPRLLVLFVLLAGLASASLVVPKTWHWHRYLMPYYALILPFAAVGLEQILGALGGLSPGTPQRALDRIGFGVYAVLALPGTLYFLIAFALNSADIAFQQRSLAEWSRVNIPAGALIAVNDAGALAYYGNHPILDLEGLVTPSLTESRRHGTSSLYEALERLPEAARPGYFIVYPNWYDAPFLKPHTLLFQRRIFRQTIVGGNPMNVYQADWSGAGSGDLPSSPEILGIVGGKTLIDRLDVSDLVDEKAHRYHFSSIEGQYQGLLESQPADAGGGTVTDGGRVVSGGEEFRLRGITPGRDLIVVIRSRSGFRIRIRSDGEDAGEWLEAGRAGQNWTESTYTIPGALVRSPRPALEVRPAEFHATAYSVFHYWFYQ